MSAAAGLTVAARSVLLDALTALGGHTGAVVLVGAQAVYLRTDNRNMTFAASYTSDGDLTIDPRRLADSPLLDDVMRGAGFTPANPDRLGIWATTVTVDGQDQTVTVDLLVPEALAGPGRRAATVGVHGRAVATRAVGLEAALVDNSPLTVAALDPADPRRVDIAVAGLPALLVAKVHKLHERVTAGKPHRIRGKDAADIYRILLGLDPGTTPAVIARLQADELSAAVTTAALDHLDTLFGTPSRPGTTLAVTALAGDIDAALVRQVCVNVTRSLRAL